MHLRYVGDWAIGGGGGVQGSPRPVNDLIGSQPQKAWITTKSVDNHKKAWITRGGGGGGSIYIYIYQIYIYIYIYILQHTNRL